MLSPIRAFARLFPFFFLASALSACGGAYKTTKVKDYRLHVVDGTPEQVADFKKLVAAFNSLARMQVLTYADSAAAANSPIILTKGLKLKTGDKVGLGQWLSDSEEESPMTTMPGSRPERVIRFTMRVEFDQDYFDTHKSDSAADTYAKQKLFFHEVGHGLELEHTKNPSDLMYEEISGEKNFEGFFTSVRNYMHDT